MPPAENATRPKTYLVSQDTSIPVPASLGPLDLGFVIDQLAADPAVSVERRITPRGVAVAAAGAGGPSEVLVAALPEQLVEELSAHQQVVVEEDFAVLPHPIPAPISVTGEPVGNPLLVSPFGTTTSWTIKLASPSGEPVAGATVFLYGSGLPAQGQSGPDGKLTLSLLNESDASLRALYVNPLSGYWTLWLDRPVLTSGIENTIILRRLSDSLAGFPERQLLGWGQQAMRLDAVPDTLTGRGIKVCVVDSGAAARTHRDLAAIRRGVDLTSTPENDQQWVEDLIAHGSHCSGVIAGTNNTVGIRGFAPEAELFAARIFPGGRVSSLIDAIDYAVEQGIDVVNMSLGAGGTSQIMLQKIAEAKEKGVACIVAAGNTSGQVQFPGTSPDVLTVAAIGRDGEFPEDSYHAQQRWKEGTPDHGYFSAQFSCHGPEIDVCAPGVAVVSSVPADGYASWDGTSMAAPHVAGLAALLLAHHPDFTTGAYQQRNAARVDRLFAILKAAATPLQFGDPERSGAGLPDAVRALGLDPSGTVPVAGSAGRPTPLELLAVLKEDLLAAALLQPEPPPVITQPDPKVIALRRQLAELKAALEGAGLPV